MAPRIFPPFGRGLALKHKIVELDPTGSSGYSFLSAATANTGALENLLGVSHELRNSPANPTGIVPVTRHDLLAAHLDPVLSLTQQDRYGIATKYLYPHDRGDIIRWAKVADAIDGVYGRSVLDNFLANRAVSIEQPPARSADFGL